MAHGLSGKAATVPPTRTGKGNVSLGSLSSKIDLYSNREKCPHESHFCARNSVKVVEMGRDKQVVQSHKPLESKEIRKWSGSA